MRTITAPPTPGVIRMYDIAMDAFRDATQADFDLVMLAAAHGAKVRELAVKLHGEYRVEAVRLHSASETA